MPPQVARSKRKNVKVLAPVARSDRWSELASLAMDIMDQDFSNRRVTPAEVR